MISGVSYNVFNGEEHLLHSLKQMRQCVDFISIVAQRVSNLGNKANVTLEPIIETALSKGLVDSVFWYKPDFSIPPVMNELRKRNIGLEQAKCAGVTHFMTMDCDEYYSVNEFLSAKRFLVENSIKISAVRTYLHIKRPIWRSKMPDNTCCSFLSQIDKKTVLELNSYYPALVDGTRRINGTSDQFHMFDESIVSMKHMNLVRKNIDFKLSNSSNAAMTDFMRGVKNMHENWRFGETLNFPGKPPMEIIEVPDLFKIDRIFRR